MSSVNNKALLLKKNLEQFYKNKEHAQKFLDVIQKNTEYSLRVIEWFCNNYSKKFNIIYQVNKKDFNVYLSYKSQLDSYQKKQFDPFRREHSGFGKFQIKLIGSASKDPVTIETTVCQLNFFKWCITMKIFDYIQKHIREIKEDMNNSIKYNTKDNEKKENNGSGERKKRHSLSTSATRTCVRRYKKIIIDFE